MLSLSETPIKEQVQSPGFPSLRELHVAVDSRGYFDGMEDQHVSFSIFAILMNFSLNYHTKNKTFRLNEY